MVPLEAPTARTSVLSCWGFTYFPFFGRTVSKSACAGTNTGGKEERRMFNKKTNPWWIGAGALIVLIGIVLGIGSWQQALDNGKSHENGDKSKKKGKKKGK